MTFRERWFGRWLGDWVRALARRRRRFDRQRLGRWGEREAGRCLRRQGMRILARNFACPDGEIDIIAGDDTTVVFVEVRTRRSLSHGTPEESVNERKRTRIRKTAASFLRRYRRLDDDLSCRFDIVAIDCSRPDEPPEIRHTRDAFQWKPMRRAADDGERL